MKGYYDNYNINYHYYIWFVRVMIGGIPTLAKGRFPIVYAMETAYIDLCSTKLQKTIQLCLILGRAQINYGDRDEKTKFPHW